jgi:hypothetical protein
MKVISVKIYGATKEKLLAFLQNLFCTEDFYILIYPLYLYKLNYGAVLIPRTGSANQN